MVSGASDVNDPQLFRERTPCPVISLLRAWITRDGQPVNPVPSLG